VKIQIGEIKTTLKNEVLKREVVEDEKALEASKKVRKAASKTLRKKKSK